MPGVQGGESLPRDEQHLPDPLRDTLARILSKLIDIFKFYILIQFTYRVSALKWSRKGMAILPDFRNNEEDSCLRPYGIKTQYNSVDI